MRFAFLISCKKKCHGHHCSTESVTRFLPCTVLGAVSSPSLTHSTCTPTHCVAPQGCCPPPHIQNQEVQLLLHAAMWMFSQQHSSPFRVPWSPNEEERGDAEMLVIMGLMSQSRLGEVTRLQQTEIPVHVKHCWLCHAHFLMVSRWSHHCGGVKQKARLTERSVCSQLSGGIFPLNDIPHLSYEFISY